MSVKALDQHGRVLAGITFAFGGVESLPTTDTGVTALSIPDLSPGEGIKLDLPRNLGTEWFLVDAMVHAPAATKEGPAEVVLMRRAELREIASVARDASSRAAGPGEEISAEQKRQVLIELAGEHGLEEEDLPAALAAFGNTDDWQDRGIAAYLEGEYDQAEADLRKAATEQESDLLETLRYLGAAEYEQAKYAEAAATFRKAVALSDGDADLLNWLARASYELADWEEAEPLMRRALQIDEESYGPDHPRVAIRLNNLAQLLKATNRLAEAEPLMRRALQIGHESYGPDHPRVAIRLNNLAQLLQATNRSSEAEPLMRRALRIDEESYGPDHPAVAADLNSLAHLLQATNRLSEAEPLIRRALWIDEESFGPDHPAVAVGLNNLAQPLKATNRLAEAEPLMRRALQIDEESYGPD
ncbi:MAG: tetratricopeptide repeat protein, partial [Holophagales bacterium]|nr:tetratricopeptide repeat protein [Holophagales bacterium]